MTDPLEAGPELDERVAKACGIPVKVTGVIHGQRIAWRAGNGQEFTKRFKPSIDWGDAMEAAERFGLFDEYGENAHACALSKLNGVWRIHQHVHIDGGEKIAEHASGPTAVSLAIVALSKVTA